jgi:hypothetical protein
MAQTEYYGRTPLPAEAKPPVVATIPVRLAVDLLAVRGVRGQRQG